MATYVVGDVQGCFSALEALLAKADFQPGTDKLWLAGDLVNRGPNNLETLRFVKGLGDSALTVLGNHDLSLLAVAAGTRKPHRKDTIQDVLNAPDRDELLTWLRQRPLLHREGRYVLTHAGIPHIWSVTQAQERAREVESILRSDEHSVFFENMYGNDPDRWRDDLAGWDRLRTITNYFTRMRFISAKGKLDLKTKDSIDNAPKGMAAWFKYPRCDDDASVYFLFGHWAALQGITDDPYYRALDTGCVWGAYLSMLRLEDHRHFHVGCETN